MRATISASLALLSVCAGSTMAQAPAPRLSAEVITVAVSKHLTKQEQELFRFDSSYREGVTLNVILTLPRYTILGLDYSRTKLFEITDDQGTDLTKSIRNRDGSIATADDNMDPDAPISIPSFGESSHEFGVTISANDLPNHAATKVHLHAVLAVRYGSDEKHTVQKRIKLIKGMTLHVGHALLRLSSVEYDKNKKEWTYEFESSDNLSQIPHFAFIGPNGQVLADGPSASRSGSGTDTTYGWGFTFKKKPGIVSVDATYFADLGVTSVDLDTDVGLGM